MTPVTFTVLTGGGMLSVETTRTNANGQADSTLHPRCRSRYTVTVEVSVEGISETVTFTAEALPPTLTSVSGNNQSAAVGTALANPFVVEVRDGNGNPLAGVAVTFVVRTGGGTLSNPTATTDANGQADSTLHLGTEAGTNTVEVRAEGIIDIVTFNAVAELLDFDLSLSVGLNLIHLPLKVREVDGMPAILQSVSDLYDVLGGGDNVIYLFTRDTQTQEWVGYFGPSDKDTTTDVELKEATGIAARLLTAKQVRLSGTPLGTNGTSTITLNPGLNFVGLPLRDSRIMQVSDLFALDGIADNVLVIQLIADGEFKTVRPTEETGDIPISGGQSFILIAKESATVGISGTGWTHVSGAAAAPSVGNAGLHSLVTDTNTTPVLGLKGLIVDQETGLNPGGFRVTVKNLSTGRAVTAVTATDETSYQHIIVDIETQRAATVGDILEISAQSADPLIVVEPLDYAVTAKDVKRSLIELPPLVAYEIPAETALLPNYPNPFNPETWIPYRLAEDAFVTLTIYDTVGQVVRTIEVGHQIASTYESQSKAIYWDGRNDVGEQVVSGVYFYTLIVRSETRADDYSATRKMLILK